MHETTLSQFPPGRSARVVFASARRDFFRLVRRGAMLELFTAGFYRFWLATDMRVDAVVRHVARGRSL